VAAAGAVAIALVSSTWQAFAAAGLSGLGAALAWPALDTLLAQLAPAEQRSGVFALRHATMNTGLAVGALASAVIADAARPASFELLYGLDAATFLAAIGMLCLIRTAPRPVPASDESRPEPAGADAAPSSVGTGLCGGIGCSCGCGF
jgi:MFS family permease